MAPLTSSCWPFSPTTTFFDFDFHEVALGARALATLQRGFLGVQGNRLVGGSWLRWRQNEMGISQEEEGGQDQHDLMRFHDG